MNTGTWSAILNRYTGGERETNKVNQTSLKPFEWTEKKNTEVIGDLKHYLELVKVVYTNDGAFHIEFCCIYRKGLKDTILNYKQTWTNRESTNEKVKISLCRNK